MCGFVLGYFSRDIRASADTIQYRGPDETQVLSFKDGMSIAFHRLAIMDLSPQGMQPFRSGPLALVCNGEIYNFKELKKDFEKYPFLSTSDCEVILPLFETRGLEKTCQALDGEFAFAIYDEHRGLTYAARDPLGIRPLFYGYCKKSQKIAFASEAKALLRECDHIKPFPPSHYFDGKEFKPYMDLTSKTSFLAPSLEEMTKSIRELLIEAVGKRLQSDAPFGFLLSGGLDSSLICAIAVKYFGKKITTFSVGLNENPIDVKYAKIVADFLKTDHHEYLFSKQEIFQNLDSLIYRLETFDITTIRASIGMDAICRYVRERTDIKVLLTGEVSDELFGYKYTDFAPSASEFQKEAKKRIDELYKYDALRADRCISSHGLEARVPFSDKHFVDYVMSLNPALKMNTRGIGKFLLREAFKEEKILPSEILYREKEAFSDGQGYKVLDYLKEQAQKLYEDKDLSKRTYECAPPQTKEALMYRDIFESFYPLNSDLIGDFWLPNQDWDHCKVMDPSARVLPNYVVDPIK
jgi:asparagine synthase (glutamine-hydrolysing)